MTLYSWANFACITIVLASWFGLPQPLARVMLFVAWLVMFLILLFDAFGRRL